MTIQVDIADRLYDYTDEERATEAVADYQVQTGLDDVAIIALWNALEDPRRAELERLIFDAVDMNGSVRRSRETVPGGISLAIEETV